MKTTAETLQRICDAATMKSPLILSPDEAERLRDDLLGFSSQFAKEVLRRRAEEEDLRRLIQRVEEETMRSLKHGPAAAGDP